jgi:hypothetical protein
MSGPLFPVGPATPRKADKSNLVARVAVKVTFRVENGLAIRIYAWLGTAWAVFDRT